MEISVVTSQNGIDWWVNWLPLISAITSALATIIAASIVGYVAYKQWNTSRQQLQLNLFDKRYEIYKKTQYYLSSIMGKGKSDPESMRAFIPAIHDSKFLFRDQTVHEFLDKIYEESIHTAVDVGDLADNVRPAIVQKKWDSIKTLSRNLEELEEVFRPHLQVKI